MCEEGNIRSIDDVPVTHFLPNYNIYMELAVASTVLTTGVHSVNVSDDDNNKK